MTTTRFAPSPTGYLHIGNLRAAVMNWLIARKGGGTFVLRLDDTDPQRSKPEFAAAIEEDLLWLGLTWDRFERQSDRIDRYREIAESLRETGRLYECFETPEELELRRRTQLAAGRPPIYDRAALDLSAAERVELRKTRKGHWRFRLERERISWNDGILGDTSIDSASVSDPVLIRGDGQILYTLASVVDDIDLSITDIVRGADHVTNTATQIQIFQALGENPPRFAHHSLLTGAKGEALSKRLGALALRDLRAAGVEPMAVLSTIARLGSADPVELRGRPEDLVAGFKLGRFGAAPTKFNADDLLGLSAKYLHSLDFQEISGDPALAGVPGDVAEAFWLAVRGNLNRRDEIAEWWRICEGKFDPEISEEDQEFVAEALALLPKETWTAETWGQWTAAVRQATGRKGKALFMPLRKALTGKSSGPDMAEFMPLLQRGRQT